MFMTGSISFVILCGAAIATTYTNGSLYCIDIWKMFGIMPVVVGSLIVGVVGFLIALYAVISKFAK